MGEHIHPDFTTLAWTSNDGVAGPPTGVRTGLLGAIAAAMGAVWIGVLSTGTLCPEHRAWVLALASLALVTSAVAVVGLVKQKAWSAWFTLLSATLGIGIGLIDAVHDLARGSLIAVVFAVVAAGVAAALLVQMKSAAWARATARSLAPVDVTDGVEVAPGQPASQPVPVGDVVVADLDQTV